MDEFRGVFVAVATPFDADGRLDEAALRSHIEFLLASGVHGIVAVGGTGEALSLDQGEYERVVALSTEQVAGRLPVIAGTFANATHRVIANCRFAESVGVDGLLLVHPYYSMPTQDELVAHYARVSEAVTVPIIVYNNPHTTGIDATPDVLARLAGMAHIEYVKECSGDSSRTLRIADASEGRLRVLCGNDNQALEAFVCGATGWISGSANVIPEQCVALFTDAFERRDYASALGLYREIHPFFQFFEASGMGVQAVKAGMQSIGRPLGEPRLPLRSLPSSLRPSLEDAVRRALRAPLPSRSMS